jgi:hypothetical protein
MGMKKLGRRNYTLISNGVKTHGTFDPKEILYIFEEELYASQVDEIEQFLQWCHDNGKSFGHANYEDRFKEFKASEK